MSGLRFEWDERKNGSNRRKHDVSFEEAQTAFSDEHGLLLDDPEHSEDEDRFVLLGMSPVLRLLVVATAIAQMVTSSALYLLAVPIVTNKQTTGIGGDDEETIRFFEGSAESLREEIEEGSHDSAG